MYFYYSWTVIVMTTVSFLAVQTSSALASPQQQQKIVLVSGAGGQTGKSLFKKLLSLPDEFQPIGLVRSEESKQALLLQSAGEGTTTIPEESVIVVDVTQESAVQKVVNDILSSSPSGIFAFCICTSAKPVPGTEVNPETGRPSFTFPNGDPELVDWIGQKNQIDSCPEGTHIVLCSTMGGTNPNHPLNAIGRTTDPTDGTTKGGMIVQWKRKSEMYLMEQSPKLKYTIIHPGGLLNEVGGRREYVVGVDDDMAGTESRSIPREDVAQLMLEAIRYPEQYSGRSFDVRAKLPAVGEDVVTTDFVTLLDSLGGKNCDYSLGATM